MPYYVLIPVFAKEVLGGGAGTYGALMSAAGVGAVLGSLYAASSGAAGRKGALLTAGSVAFPVLLSGFALSRSYPLSLVLLGAVGFSFVIQNAPANSLIQALVPDHLRGRVMAIYVCLLLGLMRVGGLLAGVLAHALSAPVALAGLSAVSLLGSLVVSSRFPELRRMQ
jgi:hypothetical protein